MKEQIPKREGRSVFVSFGFATGSAARLRRRVEHDCWHPVVRGAMYWAIS